MVQEGSDLPKLSAPAHRALASVGIERLEQLSRVSEAEIKKLHGMGPNGLQQLRAALAAKGLSFAAARNKKVEPSAKQSTALSSAPTTEEQLRAVTVGELVPLVGQIQLVAYDPAWPGLFEREEERIRAALGERVLLIEHAGSTSVPELAAKPRIDIILAVADSADEPAYVPALERVGYVLRIREPDWFEHRMFNGPDTAVNLHVFSFGCPEIERMLLFRDWLRNNTADRQLYERTKRELARQDWEYTQNYADAKTAVVKEILVRAEQSFRDGSE